MRIVRTSRLLAGTAISSGLLVLAPPAAAQSACGAPSAGGAVTCTPAGDPYPDGISYTAPAGDLSVTVQSGVVASGLSVFAQAGATTIVNDGAISTSAADRTGVSGRGRLGLTLTSLRPISTSGDGAPGVFALTSQGAGVVTVGDVTTTGQGASGVFAQAGRDLTVTAGAVSTRGDEVVDGDVGPADSTGINASSVTGSVTVNAASVAVTGRNTTGVFVFALAGDATVTVGSAIGGLDALGGVEVYADEGTATVRAGTVSGREGAVGSGGRGVRVTTTGAVTTTGPGGALAGYSGGNVSLRAEGPVTTSGANGFGLEVSADGGADLAILGALRTSGTAADGANVDVGGAVALNNTGGVATTGAGARGVFIRAGGPVSLSGGGVIATTGGGATGVRVLTPATVDLSLAGVTTAAADANAIEVSAGGGGGLRLSGVIRSAAQALSATGGAFTISNAGTLEGGVTLGAGADAFTNTGTLSLTRGADFGAGADRLTNSGTVRLAAGAPAVSTLAGLETFANTGVVTLANGRVGDRLVIPGAFSGAGGSSLVLDVGAGFAGATDVLQTGAATGSTVIRLNPVATADPVLNPGATVVQAAAGASPTAFTLDPAQTRAGLIEYGLAYDPAAFRFILVGSPGPGVYQSLRLAEGGRALWAASSDAWSGRLRAVRDGTADAAPGALWLVAHGASRERSGALAGGAFGQARTVAADYDQATWGVQAGWTAPRSGPISWGVTAGYAGSDLDFVRTPDRLRYEAVNFGLHVGVSRGPAFVDLLARYQKSWNTVRAASSGFSIDLETDQAGVVAEAGFRLGGPALFLEPLASLDFVGGDAQDFTRLGGAFRFDAADGLRGRFGGRAGATRTFAGVSATFHLGAQAVHEFLGRDGLVFTSGGQSIRLRGSRLGDYAELTAGASAELRPGVRLFVEGVGDFGGLQGGGGRGGITIRF